MPLWERVDALAVLDGLLRDARRGGRVALVAGEAGIGKSSLVRAFAASVRGRVLWGGCDPLVTPRALGPLHDIGRQTGGVLAERLAARAGHAELFAALLDELEGPARRTVVIVEDVHWADEATLDLLVLLVRRMDRLRALLVLTYRDDELGADHPLHGALGAFPRDVVRAVTLPPLSRDCVAEQAAAAGRDPAGAYELTGGNPLLLTELLHDGDARGAVRGLILDRLRRLSGAARDLAELAAVMPTLADPVIAAGAAELVDQCVAEGVLVAADGGVGYRHELLRRVVADALPPARRTALHRRALRMLAAAEGVDPARLAHHAGLAGDAEALRRYGTAAAESAAAQGAHREATAHYRALVPYAGSLPGGERAELLESYAFQAYLAGLPAEGLDARRAAAEERRRRGEIERVGENLRWISRLAWWSGDTALARDRAVEAVELLETIEPGRELAMAYSNRSQLHMLAHELDAAVDWGDRAIALAERLGDLETAVHAAVNVGTARLDRCEPEAAEMLLRQHRIADAAGLVDHAARALVNRAAGGEETGDVLAAVEAVEVALRYAREHDLDGYVQYLLGVRAAARFELCDWDGALADADESLSRPNRIGVAVVPALVARGRIQSGRGDPAALSTLDRALELALTTEEIQRIGPVAVARSEHFLIAGDPARAAAEAGRWLALATEKRHRRYGAELRYHLWRAGGGQEQPDGPFGELTAGRWRAAAEHWERIGRRFTRLSALGAGDADAAGAALRVLDDLGARRTAAWLRADLRRRGVRGIPRGPRPATAANAAGLTGRQAEVLRLLAEGLSNADIATRLTLSQKTVQHHVSAILDKLGAGSRTQAAAAARRRGLL
ncbi:AAA family ATPase [Dactylosporangium roseum]|uniref:AAA family ATPase n=1 Tax=Dactylosporangium roseum TaxID=47989 RepID=A0ABY5ZAJ5_9ACTN|nr:LuxR family transcriptional regulator [Dactylosporangium roseum]UWZ37394.1 AAA family ATPase [Dactylosporangium roseum]